ncbi:MAG: DUF362 domain-containing protein [Syntrophomonadaceae bacterium]
MTQVIVQECLKYDQTLLREKITSGIDLLGGWDQFISPGMKVLLKVNLIGPKKSETAAVTHSEFVRALTVLLRQRGCEVWIGDSAGGAIAGIAPTAQGLVISGLKTVAEEEGAILKNFDKEGVVEVTPHSHYVDRMYLARPMFEADLVINLPKLKTHSAGIYTGAVKNLFGCIPGLRKAEYHRLAPTPQDLGHMLTDIHQALKVGLHIMDGVTAMQGEGPTAGEVYPAGKILMSRDPLALDTVATAMLGMELDDIPILVSARERGLGESDLNRIQISGDYDRPPRLADFKYPKRFRSTKAGNHAVLVRLIDFLKTRPKVNPRLCKACDMCVESCPVQAIDESTKKIDYHKCIECMCCHELCLHQAVELKRDSLWAEIFTRLYRSTYR